MALDPKKLEKLVTTLQADVTSLKRRLNLLEAERPAGPSTERFLWELRYRGAMSVDNVLIETLTKQEEEANALGQWYLDSLATPSVRFVRARRIVVARTVDVPPLLAGWTHQPIEVPTVSEDEEMAPAASASPSTPIAATPPKVKETGTPPPAGKTAAPRRQATVAPPKGTDPPPVPEGSRVQTHDTDPRAAVREAVMTATRTGRITRLGD